MIVTGDAFALDRDTPIVVGSGHSELGALGDYLANRLYPATGFTLPVEISNTPIHGAINLLLDPSDAALGREGYNLQVSREGVVLRGPAPAGVFYGMQTMRQLLPPAIESHTAQAGPWTLPGVTIRDYPRFAWRGAMLDVARHFFGVDDVKRYIDLLAYYKFNRLHLHLTDDQGWRIEIKSWAKLAEFGGRTAVDGAQGGYYTQDEYADLVAYAASRQVMIVPEIDMPGHCNAALASYPELNCSGVAPEPYTGIEVGFSSLCVDEEITYRFIGDVIRELAALTPGPFIHIGGDEARSTPDDEYLRFIQRVQDIVHANGKRMIGWGEIARARLLPTSVVQHWDGTVAAAAADQGAKLILSPAAHTYLDMKYDETTAFGLHWAGYIEVLDAYDWDPGTTLEGVDENDILGVEAPLWSETLLTLRDVEYMALPRMAGIAEIAWSPASERDTSDYVKRLAEHGKRWDEMGVNYYRSPQVPW